MATFISRSLSLVRRATGAARAIDVDDVDDRPIEQVVRDRLYRNRSLSHGIEVTRGSRSSTSPRS